MVALVIFATCVGVPIWLFKPTKIIVSRETTYLLAPLDSEGYVDYLEALDRKARDGVTPENNAMVPLLVAYGTKDYSAERLRQLGILTRPTALFVRYDEAFSQQSAEETRQEFDEAGTRPWSEEEFPRVAAWLEQNAAAAQLVLEASRRPRRYSPFERGSRPATYGALLPHVTLIRDLYGLLLVRVMHHLKAGRFAEAREELLAVHRLSRLYVQGPTVFDLSLACALEDSACRADVEFAKAAMNVPAETRTLLRELRALPVHPEAWQKADVGERFQLLDAVMCASRYGLQSSVPVDSPGKPWAEIPASAVDWNIALRRSNVWIDRTVAALKEPWWRDRRAELDRIADELVELDRSRPLGFALRGNVRRSLGETVGDKLAMWSLASLVSYTHDERRKMRFEMTQIALALSLWKAEHGAYPHTLDELVPTFLESVPEDRFSESPLIYELTAKGFTLTSLGQDGIRFGAKPGTLRDDVVLDVP